MKYALSASLTICFLILCIQESHAYRTNGVIVYPVPYYPGKGVFQAVDLSGTTFNKVKMKIYNIEGEQVFSGVYPGYPVIWNGRNDSGERADPGMYTVKIEADNIFTGLHAEKTVSILTNGGSRGTFTRGGWIGAKYIAMGKSGEVIADDVYSIYWNPAGLTELRHTQLLTAKEIKEKAEKGKVQDITERDLIKFSEEEKSFSVQFGVTGSVLAFGSNTGFAGMAINLPKGVLGVGLYTIYSGGIDRRDFNGYKTGELQYVGSALYLSYGVSLGISSFGFSLKGLYEKIGNNRFMGAGADVGTQVYVLPFLKVGLMIQDLGSGMYPLETSYGTPHRYNFTYPTLRLGIAIITNRNFTLSVSGIKKLDEEKFGYSIGAQYDIVKWASVYIGMQNLVFSAGLTFHVVQFDVSYAFTMDTVNKGFNHIVSASVMF
ncbi:MAG: hypothetical protein A2W19_12970 [Spirochaetes bacterium RBG_16_49_21]|nr:MAG: hypothetical protein A2W19_12970 [Spirochaetes bacterium RBG_16_49_21]